MPDPLYIVTYDYFDSRVGRHFSGNYDLEDHTRLGVTYEIANGHVTGIRRVYECVPGGACTDITGMIAITVANYLTNEQEPATHDVACWLHINHPRGVMSTHGLPRAA